MPVKKSKQVKKFLDSQDKPTRKRLETALDKLPSGDTVPIVGLPNTFRLRVGNYRAIFVQESDVIKVTLLDVRGQIYKRGGRS